MILIPESGRSVAKSQGHLGNVGYHLLTLIRRLRNIASSDLYWVWTSVRRAPISEQRIYNQVARLILSDLG